MSNQDTWALDGLTIGYTDTTIVRDIDHLITAGDHVVIAGANGSGKSCLLRTLSGELPPLSGSIRAPKNFNAQQLAVVPQVSDLTLRLSITLGEMVSLGTAGLPRRHSANSKQSLLAVLKQVGLERRAQQAWQRSSGGEQQRALIARALIRQPRVLLLDEPSSHLDEHSAEHLFSSLEQQCREQQLTIVSVLHDRALTERFANALIQLDQQRATITTLRAVT